MSNLFTKTAYTNVSDLVYGNAIYPVKLKNGMTIGGGTLYPEVNFTLPTMLITEETMPEVIRNYHEIITGICVRARELCVPGFVAEIELLPPTTTTPEWGIEVCKTVVDVIKEHSEKYGVKGAVRITPVDIREGKTLEHMWHGKHWENVLKTFEGSAKAGADFLAIESVGGKEVHDEGVMYCDIGKVIFSLAVLGCRDMNKLWAEIVKIADQTGSIPSGDTACGFANTAMVLAEQNYIPRVFAAAARVAASVRSIVAMEQGAKGPDKDCGYEGVYIKAITGRPISMEGRIAACAHLSRVGNIAICLADLWSNESVQNIKLLGGMAPTIGFEQLVYDCRIMNGASARGKETALLLRDLNCESDSSLDPHAYILRPDVVLDISKEIVKEDNYYARTKTAVGQAVKHMREGYKAGQLQLNEKEVSWLDTIDEGLAGLPADESGLIEKYIDDCENFKPKFYDM